MDRAMYIWGCARTGCQHQDGRCASIYLAKVILVCPAFHLMIYRVEISCWVIYQIHQLIGSLSVRAWRGLRVNKKYAEKLARKRERERTRAKAEEERQRLEAQRKNPQINPFSVSLF